MHRCIWAPLICKIIFLLKIKMISFKKSLKMHRSPIFILLKIYIFTVEALLNIKSFFKLKVI